MIDRESVRRFYTRLNHSDHGVTELAVIDPTGRKGIIATGFFESEDSFVKACQEYNGRYNIYAGRNPRPSQLPKACPNRLDVRYRQRAGDSEIETVTAISLDIDPVRTKGTSATDSERKRAVNFACHMQKELGGCVDNSGNGAYLWFSFATPIKLTAQNRSVIKQKCRQWQKLLVQKYQPENQGLRIDGCYDFSRLKKVIGTLSVKGSRHRLSRFIVESEPSDTIRDAIMSADIALVPASNRAHSPGRYALAHDTSRLPVPFLRLLQTSTAIQSLWCMPDEADDASKHDWELGCACIQAGITDATDIATILRHSPFGKFMRDGREDYLLHTVRKLMLECVS